MDLKERIRVALGLDEATQEATEVKLAFEAKLADGTIIVSEAEELAAGAVVNILSEDGEQTPLPEGTYALEDGTEFTIGEDGVVAEVAEAQEEETEEQPQEEEMAEEPKPEAELLAEVGTVVKELLEEVRNDISRLTAELDELRGENLAKDENIADLQEENTNLSAQVNTLKEEPAAEPVKLSKFAEPKQAVKLSTEEYSKMTAREKYLHNFNNLK